MALLATTQILQIETWLRDRSQRGEVWHKEQGCTLNPQNGDRGKL